MNWDPICHAALDEMSFENTATTGDVPLAGLLISQFIH